MRLREVVPGAAVTLALWLVGATAFGQFLAYFTHLKTTYAGLVGIVTALIFMQLSAAIFIFGAELNAAIRRRRPSAASDEALPAATFVPACAHDPVAIKGLSLANRP